MYTVVQLQIKTILIVFRIHSLNGNKHVDIENFSCAFHTGA